MGSRKDYNSRGYISGYTTKNTSYYSDKDKPKKKVMDSDNFQKYYPPKRYEVNVNRWGNTKDGKTVLSKGCYECDTFSEVKRVLKHEDTDNYNHIHYWVNDNSREQYVPHRIKDGYQSSYRGKHTVASGDVIGNNKHKVATTFNKKFFDLD